MCQYVEYGFQVRTKSANGVWGDFNSPIYWSSSKPSSSKAIPDMTSIDEKDGVQVRVAVGVIGKYRNYGQFFNTNFISENI